MKKQQKTILDMDHKQAKKFFLKSESYTNIHLPQYFNFGKLLEKVNHILERKRLSDFQSKKPSEYKNNNHTIWIYKGQYEWRPLQLIHPAIYVDLVNKITKEKNWTKIKKSFKEFSRDEKIACMSIPVESQNEEKDKAARISQWWQKIEQRSIELALDYKYILNTDIADCYSSIYTHVIAWALHTEEVAKNNKENTKDFIGNGIDKSIQSMQCGETNGIPQGSVLMDFIAEMVLGYIDLRISQKIPSTVSDYQIIRYRDDYRIFTNNPVSGKEILKIITEIMSEHRMQLNRDKTISADHDQVILSSIKKDKLAWDKKKQKANTSQKDLLIIYMHAKEYPNSGSLDKALLNFYKTLRKQAKKQRKLKSDVLPIISIAVEIALHNHRTYPIISAILSILIARFDDDDFKRSICEKIYQKFQKTQKTGYMQIWIQRLSMFFTTNIEFTEKLTKGNEPNTNIWCSDWIKKGRLKSLIDNPGNIVDEDIKKRISPEIEPDEVAVFKY